MDLAFLKVSPFAHRGLHNSQAQIPENSVIAFHKAIEKGYAIELDVHLLADGEIVVFHDDDLKRLCGEDITIRSVKSTELLKYKLGNSTHKIPLLKEVLNLVEGKVPLLIEIKNTAKPAEIGPPLVNLLDNYKGVFAIQAFNPFHVLWFKRNRPSYIRGQLSGSFGGEKIHWLIKWLLKGLRLNFLTKTHFISYEHTTLANPRILRLKSNGIGVLAWTINSEAECSAIKTFCDNIIFEGFYPE